MDNGPPDSDTGKNRQECSDPGRQGQTAGELSHDPPISALRLLNTLPCLVYRCRNDKQWTMEFVSEGCMDLLGYKPSDLLENRTIAYAELIHPQDRQHVWQEVQAALGDRRPFNVAYRVLTASGEQKWVWEQGHGLFSPSGRLTALQGTVSNISQHTATQGKVERLNRVLRAIRNVSRLLVKEKDPLRLLRGICDNLVENRGYFNTWIALFDDSNGLTHATEAGLGAAFLPLMEQLQEGKWVHCIRRACAQESPEVIENPITSCTDCPLSPGYRGRGAITARLYYSGNTYGVLSASVPKHVVADPGEKDLFAEISGEIAFALHQMELEQQYQETHEELRVTSTYAAENPYPVFRITTDGTIVYANEGSRRVLEKWGRHSGEKIPADWLDIVSRVMTSGMEEETEMEIDDDVFSFVVVPVEGSDYVNIYGLDITRRRRMEKALKKSERQFRDLVENSLVGIGILRDGNIIYRNPEQERLWGAVSDGAGGSAFDHVHPDDADKVQRALQQIVGGKSPYVDMELRMISSSAGDEKPPMKWVHCRASLTEHQGAKAVLVNMMDVTRMKQLENLLRVEDKMASLGRVAAGIAHEIRNPLSGINIYLSTLEKIYDKKESHDTVLGILERLKSASDKIESVIRRVMDFAKPGMPHFVMGNINEPVEEAINLASVTLRKRGIKIEKRLSTNLSDCRIDRQMIESVVLNLITNAIEAMKDVDQTNKIRVSSYVKGNHVRITVSDSGPGIPPGLQDSIFDPFYTTKNGSTGIGLSLSRRFIADHGGSLRSSKSRLGGGKFTIEIPIAQRKHTP